MSRIKHLIEMGEHVGRLLNLDCTVSKLDEFFGKLWGTHTATLFSWVAEDTETRFTIGHIGFTSILFSKQEAWDVVAVHRRTPEAIADLCDDRDNLDDYQLPDDFKWYEGYSVYSKGYAFCGIFYMKREMKLAIIDVQDGAFNAQSSLQ